MDVDNCGDYLQHPALTAPPPRSLRAITLTLWLALGVEAFFAVLSIAAYALRLHVITSIVTGAPLSQQTVVSSDHFVRIVAQLSVPMLIIVLVILLVWVHDARKNLEAFRAGPFLYSPGMAVGSFLIPVANFWWPYLVVREIWRGSDPGLPPFRLEPLTTRRRSSLVALWWVAFLANNLFSWVVAEVTIYSRGDGFSGLRLTAELQIASRVLRLVSVALTAALAYRIMRRQDALRLQMAPSPEPPQRELAPAMGLPPAAV